MQSLQEPYNQFSLHDETKLTELVNSINRGLFCEIGCWTGHSTSIIARRAKEIGSKVIVIDNFEGNDGTPLYEYAKVNPVKDYFVENMKMRGLWDNIILFNMDSNEAHTFLKNNLFNFLFIDAGHTYSQVKSDLINYLPKLTDSALVCGHDYESSTYNEQYINEDYVDGKHHGVIKAVNEIIGRVNYEGRMWWNINDYQASVYS
jgi:predicted O-methyltransferase YrrM